MKTDESRNKQSDNKKTDVNQTYLEEKTNANSEILPVYCKHPSQFTD